tara:strand:- start:1540 stop:1815 length:276 start_codon:yes stop_codon:yes gene_type:complete
MRHVVKPHVMHGVYRVPGKQVKRKWNILVPRDDVIVLFESELCVQQGRRRLLGDWTCENNVVVWRAYSSPSTDVTPLEHSALLASIFAYLF